MQKDPNTFPRRVQHWLEGIEPSLPAGAFDSDYELIMDGEAGIAIENAVDRLDDLSRPLTDDELSALRGLLEEARVENELIDKWIARIRTFPLDEVVTGRGR